MKQKFKNITLAPFCYSHLSINQMIKVILLCLIPNLIMLMYFDGYKSVSLFFIIVLAAICSELFYKLVFRIGVSISWPTIFQGALIGILIPIEYSAMLAFIVTLIVLFFEKLIFKNFAQSWLSPVAFTVIILYFMNPQFFPVFLLTPDMVQYQNIGTKLFSDGILQISNLDKHITAFLNMIFNNVEIYIPEGYLSLLFDTESPIPAFRFNIVTLVASIILLTTKTIDALIPTVFLVTYTLLVFLFSLFPYAEIIGGGDMFLALCTSGTFFFAFYLLNFGCTTPHTLVGKIINGMGAGVLHFLISGAGTSTIGVIFVLLLLNLLNPIILEIESVIYVSQLRKTLEETKR